MVTYDLDGLRDLKITEENAVVVSKIIYDRYKHSNGIDVFKGGRYSYFYYSPCTNYVNTEIYAKLQSTPWVLTNENKLDVPKNIPTSSLNTEVLFFSRLIAKKWRLGLFFVSSGLMFKNHSDFSQQDLVTVPGLILHGCVSSVL